MKNALLLLSAFLIAGSTATFAQTPAGPEANPNKRLDCTTGNIRNDSGTCVPVDSYLSTGANRIYWVDQRAGNDSNPGTKDRPWKTIQRANKRGQLTAGDAVIIRGGVYREAVRPSVSGQSGARITYAAYPGENVVVSGAVPANDGWTLHSGSIYKRPVNISLDIDCPWDDCSSVSWRRELLVVNGSLMNQVGVLSNLNGPGQFFVDGFPPATASKWIYARFPKDQAPGNFNIEVGNESTLFLPEGTTERTCRGDKGHYRVIGVTFRHATNYRQSGAVCSGERGSLFEEVTIESTNALGINLSGEGHILRGNRAINNGQSGIQGGCDKCLLEYNESSANNWRRHPRGYSGGGGKFSNSDNTIIRYHLAKDNIGRGLWLDNSNYNNIIEKSFFINNEIAGLHLENKSNYNIVRNNVFHGTRWQGWTGSGLLSHAANNNTIVHNTFIANEGTGLWIRYNNREPDGYNKIFNNLFVNNATTADVNKVFEIALVTETNQLDGNIYWSHKGLAGPTFQYAATGWKGDDIATWRSLTGGEKGAKVIERSTSLIESLSSADGWRLVSNSVAIGNAVPLPSAIEPVRRDIEDDPRSTTGADIGADEYIGGETTLPVTNTTIGESGTVSIKQSSGSEWHRLSFKQSYVNPAVVMSKLTYNGPHPLTIRVRNVTSGGCEFQIDEWDYLDGRHAQETLAYVVVDAGKHTLENGQVIQAGHTVVGIDKQAVAFSEAFSTRPVVFSQIVTDHDARAAVTRQADASKTGFGIFLQPQQSVKSYGNEKVSWIAIDGGSGSTAGKKFEAGATGNVVSDSWYNLSFAQNFAAGPVVLTSMQTANGRDVAGLRLRDVTSAGAVVAVEEEQSADKETRHVTEVVGYLSIEAGLIEGSSVSLASSAVAASAEAIDQAAQSAADAGLPDRFALHENYPNPFNPRTTIRYDLPKESHVQLEVFDVVGRRVALLADGPHQAGTHEVHFEAESLPSGLYLYRMKAGTFVQTGRMLLVK